MARETSSFSSIRILPPLNNGGPIARSKFCFQDHVAISFCLELINNPLLKEVWCETQDDITLIWSESSIEKIEFVQVKGNEFDHLWTAAELCKREKSVANPHGKGTSILERSLANDRCREDTCFRLITSLSVNKELKALTYPLSSPERANTNKKIDALVKTVKRKLNGYVSPKGNDCEFWIRNTLWQVEHSDVAVVRHNIESILGFIDQLGWGMSPKDVRTHIYPKLLEQIQNASSAEWAFNPERKKIKKADFTHWLQTTVIDNRHLALGASGKTLREKMVDKAALPLSYFDSAVEERIKYKQETLQQNYLELSDRNLIEGEVYSELQHLLLKLDTGEFNEGLEFYKICEERLRVLQSTLFTKTPPPLFFIKGCMHEITDRCGHRYHREPR